MIFRAGTGKLRDPPFALFFQQRAVTFQRLDQQPIPAGQLQMIGLRLYRRMISPNIDKKPGYLVIKKFSNQGLLAVRQVSEAANFLFFEIDR